MFTAEMAREMVANNDERNELIKQFIEETEEDIKNACKRGERKSVMKYSRYDWEQPYTEVFEHFKELGFEIKRYRDGSGYYITW